MFRKIGLGLASVTLVLMMAANQVDAMMYADTVLDAEVGTNQKPAPTDNPANALGEPDLFTIPLPDIVAAYYDLGHLGTLTLGFPDSFGDLPGVDVVIWEVSASAEWMDIQLEVDGGVQTISPIGPPSLVGTRSGDSQFRFEFDLADLVGVSPGTTWNQLTIVDKTTTSAYGGADIDAVGIISIPEPAIEATIDIDPDTLNLQSKGEWITCYIWLPEGYDVADIDPESILLNGQVAPDWGRVDETEQMLIVKFNRSEVQAIVEPGEVQLTVSGELTDGTKFEGADTITVID